MTSSSHTGPLGQFEDQADIGSVDLPGSCEYDPARQAYTITGAGSNIWGDHDDFHFVWKRMSGNFIVTMRAAFVRCGQESASQVRLDGAHRTSTADSPHVSAAIHGDGLLSLQFRRTPGGQTEEVRSSLTGADVIQLERKGNTYIMSVARYGEPFSRCSGRGS